MRRCWPLQRWPLLRSAPPSPSRRCWPALPSPGRKEEAAVATPEQLRLEDARVLAKENPMAVANILKTWLNGEPA